jgi:hypothetical protein
MTFNILELCKKILIASHLPEKQNKLSYQSKLWHNKVNESTGKKFGENTSKFYHYKEKRCKAIENWHNESPLYNEYMLIKKFF